MSFLRRFFPTSAKTLANRLIAGGDPDEVLAGLGRGRRVEAIQRAVRMLDLDDRLDEHIPLLLALAELDPDAVLPKVDVLLQVGEGEVALEVCAAVLKAHPGNVLARQQLYMTLLELGRDEEAFAAISGGAQDEPTLELSRVEALLAQGREEEARTRLEAVLDLCEARLRHAIGPDDFQTYNELVREGHALRDQLLVETEGREALILDAARRGVLDRHAGVNYRLLGQAAMAQSPRIAASLTLQDPDALLADLEAQPPDGDREGMVRMAESYLRIGLPKRAKPVLQRLREAHPGFFPAELGYGAALTLERSPSLRVIDALPREPVDPGWETVIPDWGRLSDRERRVVAASVRGLGQALPGLVGRGMTLHILPLDVRPVDLPAFASAEGERSEDGRALAGIGGMASIDGVAVARVEDLLDVTSEGSWVFAHELAHLAFWALPRPLAEAFESLFAEATEIEWAWMGYQAQNVDEFFACSYQYLLQERYGDSAHLLTNGAGQWGRVRDFLRALE